MRIVVLDGYTLNPGDLSWQEIGKFGDITIYDRTEINEIVERCTNAEIVLTNKVPIDGIIMSQLKNLKYIGVTATGYNIIDVKAATAAGIVVTNVPGYSTASVAQLCFAFMLEFTHHVQQHSDSVKKGDWVASADFCYWNFPLIELEGKSLGIIGFGTIGQKLAEIATAFGMRVLVNSRTRREPSDRNSLQWVELDELLIEADFISIHCPLTSETKGMINKESLSKMKKTSFLINTARGPIVVDDELAEALNNGTIAGAGIDVLSIEPPKSDNPLLHAKNCFITPHIGWATKEARSRLMKIVGDNITAFASGKPQNLVKV